MLSDDFFKINEITRKLDKSLSGILGLDLKFNMANKALSIMNMADTFRIASMADSFMSSEMIAGINTFQNLADLFNKNNSYKQILDATEWIREILDANEVLQRSLENIARPIDIPLFESANRNFLNQEIYEMVCDCADEIEEASPELSNNLEQVKNILKRNCLDVKEILSKISIPDKTKRLLIFLLSIIIEKLVEVVVTTLLGIQSPNIVVYNQFHISDYYLNQQGESVYNSAQLYRNFSINNLYIVNKDNVKIYRSNSLKSGVCAKLPIGKLVELVHKNKKWCQIKWINEDVKYSGWVQNYYLDELLINN